MILQGYGPDPVEDSYHADIIFFTLEKCKFGLVFSYRAIHGQAPVYIQLLHPFITSRSYWSSDQGFLVVPCTRLRTKGDHAFEVVAPTLWNALLIGLRNAASVDTFKR